MLPLPPTFRLVSWPVRFIVAAIALGAAWMMLEGWATGVRLSRLMTEIGARQAAAEAAAARARQMQDQGDPGIVYVQKLPPPKPR